MAEIKERNFQLSKRLNKLGSACPVIVRHEFENHNDKVSKIMSMGSTLKTKNRPQSAMTRNTQSTTTSKKLNRNKMANNKNGPLSQAMVPLEFDNMQIRQKNSSKYFQPRIKLKTANLKKVLFNLKREKEDLDKNLERLELISNFGETHLKHSNTYDEKLIKSLNMKANPVQQNTRLKRPTTGKHKLLRSVQSEQVFGQPAKQRPRTAMDQLKYAHPDSMVHPYGIPENDEFEENLYDMDPNDPRAQSGYGQNDTADLMRTRNLMQTTSEITIGVGKAAQISIREQAKDYLKKNADEFRKNSHQQHWAPPEIFLLRGNSLKAAQKHLEVNNIKKMNDFKKGYYKLHGSMSKPSIVAARTKQDFSDMRLDGKKLATNAKKTRQAEMDMMIQAYMHRNQLIKEQEAIEKHRIVEMMEKSGSHSVDGFVPRGGERQGHGQSLNYSGYDKHTMNQIMDKPIDGYILTRLVFAKNLIYIDENKNLISSDLNPYLRVTTPNDEMFETEIRESDNSPILSFERQEKIVAPNLSRVKPLTIKFLHAPDQNHPNKNNDVQINLGMKIDWKSCVYYPGTWAINREFPCMIPDALQQEYNLENAGTIWVQMIYVPTDALNQNNQFVATEPEKLYTLPLPKNIMGTLVIYWVDEKNLVNESESLSMEFPNLNEFAGLYEENIVSQIDSNNQSFLKKFLITVVQTRSTIQPLKLSYSTINEQDSSKNKFLGNIELDMKPCFENPGYFVLNNYLAIQSDDLVKNMTNSQKQSALPKVYLQVKFLPGNLQDDDIMAPFVSYREEHVIDGVPSIIHEEPNMSNINNTLSEVKSPSKGVEISGSNVIAFEDSNIGNQNISSKEHSNLNENRVRSRVQGNSSQNDRSGGDVIEDDDAEGESYDYIADPDKKNTHIAPANRIGSAINNRPTSALAQSNKGLNDDHKDLNAQSDYNNAYTANTRPQFKKVEDKFVRRFLYNQIKI